MGVVREMADDTDTAGSQLLGQIESERERARVHKASWRARLCALCVCSNNAGQLRIAP